MNLQDLANLILIRNHLAFLINNERTVVTKDQIRPADALKAELDRLILDEAFDLDLEGIQNGGVPYVVVEAPNADKIEQLKAKRKASKVTIESEGSKVVVDDAGMTITGKVVVDNNAVTVAPPDDEKQLSFDFTEKKPAKKKAKNAAKATAEEDKEIAERIAQAKKEVAEKKAAGSFRRASEE